MKSHGCVPLLCAMRMSHVHTTACNRARIGYVVVLLVGRFPVPRPRSGLSLFPLAVRLVTNCDCCRIGVCSRTPPRHHGPREPARSARA
eukprot:1796595-Prymnesium_polylepis.2